MEEVNERDVYLPPGIWINYQTKQTYRGGQWHKIKAGPIPCVILARGGSVIPHLELAQSTKDMDWSKIELRAYGTNTEATGLFCMPTDKVLQPLHLEREGSFWKLWKGLPPKVNYTITT